MKTFIVDSYAWISYFEDVNSAFRPFIEGHYLETPAVVVSEISRVFARKKFPESKSKACLGFILDHSLVLPLTSENAASVGKVCVQENLSLVDGMIYSHASTEKKVLTGDQHFKGKKFAEFVSIKNR